MGCLQSNDKPKSKQKKFIKLESGSLNKKWMSTLQIDKLNFNIITDSKQVAEHPAYLQIQKDIKRTFPHEKHFQNITNQQIFRQTLKCFALSFPKIGYTQGLNFIIGYLLLNKIEKNDCLRIMTRLFINSSMLYIGLYEDYFPLTYLFCRLFWKILQKIDKQLFLWLKQIEIPDMMWIFQWYLTFYIYSFPMEYITYFLNFIFQNQGFALLKLSLGIIKSLKSDILNLQKQESIFLQFLQNIKNFEICKKLLFPDEVIENSQAISQQIIYESLKQLKNSSVVHNFYIKYFNSNQMQKKTLYELFVQEIQNQNLQVSKNNKDNTNLMQSYRRNSNDVQILDEILQQSIKRQTQKKNKKYHSNLAMLNRQSKIFIKSSHKKGWRSQARFTNSNDNDKKEDQTNFSVVKNIDVNNSKIIIFDHDNQNNNS